MNFTQEELTDIYRWADHEERAACFASNVERARAIKAKVSQALASQQYATPAEKTVQAS